MTRTTRGLINAAVIERMKPGVMLLNVARGGILDEQDVADALKAGRIAGAGGRRVRGRAADRVSPLLEAPNTLLTPAPRGVDRRGPGRGGRGGRRADPRGPRRTARRAYAVNAPLLTPETAQAIAPYLPLAETLGRFLGAVRPRRAADAHARDRRRAGGVRRVAARRGGPARAARDVDDGARQPRQRRRRMARARGIRVVERKTLDGRRRSRRCSR